MNEKFYQALCKIVDEKCIKVEEPMKDHTTFKVGGPADYFISPKNSGQIQAVMQLCKQEAMPFYLLGNGSNLLVGDKGFRGVIIHIGKDFSDIRIEGTTITVQAGALLSKTAHEAYQSGLRGMEFAAGIPGSIGGAVVMNAGAYGGEMKDIITSIQVIDGSGTILTLEKEKLDMGYRSSVVSKKGYIVLEMCIELEHGDKESIKSRMDELREKRTTKQPLEYPSAGSTFKRPEGYFAGKLIEDAGLRGFQVGGAKVSDKHCGFVINAGDATAADIVSLMEQVKEKVYDKFQVVLEPEVKRLGEF